ncbi:hypothetical protein [Variovorax sp. CY25R-8]|jgi:hypothetical protein|uniref:hypothetical protein n=1 Tax=Variovorax sp. CY25R-8 TaxID=2855501 RepID=UPI0021BB71C0|nr:hypothetical protein [Variovorax sp. CY25R-8]MCT8176361.1 hypothetical protein [Variovorax sp. CY25R-8]
MKKVHRPSLSSDAAALTLLEKRQQPTRSVVQGRPAHFFSSRIEEKRIASSAKVAPIAGQNRFMLSSAAIYSLCPSRPLTTLVQNACCLAASRVEHRTRVEGGESVYIVEIPRTSRMSMFDALVQLMSIELHWLEEWDRTQTTVGDAENIVKHWITPALEHFQFRESPVDEVRQEIAVRMQITASLLRASSRHPAAGVYVDDVLTRDDISVPPLSSSIVSGVLLRSEWNELDILYATADHIGLLTWETGA